MNGVRSSWSKFFHSFAQMGAALSSRPAILMPFLFCKYVHTLRAQSHENTRRDMEEACKLKKASDLQLQTRPAPEAYYKQHLLSRSPHPL